MIHGAAFVATHSLELAIWHLMRRALSVKLSRVHFYDVRNRFRQVVKQAYKLVVGAGLAVARRADAAADVWMNYPVDVYKKP